jgi:N-acetylglucosamine malate deacetylase 1
MASDAVFFGAHPDDIELTSAGLAALLASHGHAVTLVDLTRGEMASRGTVEGRAREAEQAAATLGVARRVNLGLPDTGLDARDRAQILAVVACLRAERPSLVVAPESGDPHPDHGEAAGLVTRACYLSGLARIDAPGERFRPRCLLHVLYRGTRPPRLVVDVSPVWDRRMAALHAHASQLGQGAGPATDLTHPDYLPEIEARARHFGAMIGARYGEGYRVRGPLAVWDARALITGAASRSVA